MPQKDKRHVSPPTPSNAVHRPMCHRLTVVPSPHDHDAGLITHTRLLLRPVWDSPTAKLSGRSLCVLIASIIVVRDVAIDGARKSTAKDPREPSLDKPP